MIKWPSPEIPEWAQEMGCPMPRKRETFKQYVERLGLDFEELTIDLDQRTAELANFRLAAELRLQNPESFARYIRKRAREQRERYSYQA